MEIEAFEYAVKPEKKKGARVREILAATGAVAVGVAFLWVGLAREAFLLCFLLAVGTELTAALFLRRLFAVEYEYEVVGGHVVFSEIYGGSSRRRILEFDIDRCEKIVPAAEAEAIASLGVDKTYFAVSSPEAENIFVACFSDAHGKRTAVYFEACEKMQRLCRSKRY